MTIRTKAPTCPGPRPHYDDFVYLAYLIDGTAHMVDVLGALNPYAIENEGLHSALEKAGAGLRCIRDDLRELASQRLEQASRELRQAAHP